MIEIKEHVSLKSYSTMQLGGLARYVCEIKSEDDLLEALQFASMNSLAWRVIGTGSNIVWRDEGYSGLLIINKIDGYEIQPDGETLLVGAGEEWDSVVERSVQDGLSGIEFLSYIPGSTGATPVQNVGAYGTEIKDVLVSLRSYDTVKKKFVELMSGDCMFGYRNSRFKSTDAGRYIITSITLKLSKNTPKPPFYESLQSHLDDQGVTDFTPATIRKAVIEIRTSKLPNPKEAANNGSFFENPFVTHTEYEIIREKHPDIKGWDYGDGVKLSAGWMIESAGFKDYHDQETGMATWAAQSLVLINEHASTTSDLLKFKQKIVDAVFEKFSVTLKQEPELLP